MTKNFRFYYNEHQDGYKIKLYCFKNVVGWREIERFNNEFAQQFISHEQVIKLFENYLVNKGANIYYDKGRYADSISKKELKNLLHKERFSVSIEEKLKENNDE